MNKRWTWVTILSACLAMGYWLCLPTTLFDEPFSTVIEDRDGSLLGATTAPDGQWRFPQSNFVPEKFKAAIILFEDKRFENHIGVDWKATARALRQNWNAGKVVSGGSTLTMQVIRLSRKNKTRNVWEKLVEMILATRLEWRYSKSEILALYTSHAPFGGNVIGLEAACWRYLGRSVQELSWSEAALMAVLPNNPSLIHLGKNRGKLKAKRDRLLHRLYNAGRFDALTLELALSEPVPQQPLPLPRMAPHLLELVRKDGWAQKKIRTTILEAHQHRVTQILDDHRPRLAARQIFNACALVMEVKTGHVVAYVGNLSSGAEHQQQVDIIQAPRSTGSILKPFLYAAMLDEGKLLPHALVPDVPTVINGFAPKNFSKQYDGTVPASQALIRSLNVPAVFELRDFRYEKFYELLKNAGIRTLHQPADHYGLSLILGGADATLWDITGVYASMGRTLLNYFIHPGSSRYDKRDFHAPVYLAHKPDSARQQLEASSWLSAGAIYQTFDVLKEVYRPGEETGWQLFNSSKKIAWKTGTSHGHRDGWAIGVNADFAVGVWTGNADGEGRPGLTGTEMAAPILFDIFSALPGNAWFDEPHSEFTSISVCRWSGLRASEHCEEVVKQPVVAAGLTHSICSYHQRIPLSWDGRFRVHADCESLDRIRMTKWFVLPPVQEYYYKFKSISYKPLPPFRKDCANPNNLPLLDLIYPKPGAQLFLPRSLDGVSGTAIFEAVHRNASTSIHWHLDGKFIGTTQKSHKMAISTPKGSHKITLVDEQGETLEREFFVIFGS